jgi:transcriptional regulator with XRE-family HTH domain
VDVGDLIASRRADLGLTQTELAAALNTTSGRDTVTRNEVSRWERGDVGPRYWLPHLATVLHVPLQDLRIAARGSKVSRRRGAGDALDAIRVAHEWLVSEPPQVIERRSGRRIGAALVMRVGERVAELRRLDDHLAGGDTHSLVARELETTLRLVDEASYSERTGRGLLAVAGELAQLAGWVCSDAGMNAGASGYYLTGVRAATLAGDRAGAANNLSSLAYHVSNVGDPADAALIARTAAAGAHDTPPKVRALLAERVAWAHARAGQRDETERALGQVDELLDAADGAAEPGWVYWLDRHEADVMAGRCYTELRRPLRAVPLLTRATAAYRDDSPRELALYLSWLAVAYVDARELDEARRVARRVIELTSATSSVRAHGRAELVIERLRELAGEWAIRDLIALRR